MSTRPAPPPPDIVRGTAGDLDEVMATMHTAFDPCFGEAWTQAQCAGLMVLHGVWLMLARSGRDAAGFAMARVVADEAELLLLAVPPVRRREGFGRALLAAVADEARERGAVRIHLEMRDGNPAQHLYTSAGFREVGRRARYYRGRDGHCFDAITLACPLNTRSGAD